MSEAISKLYGNVPLNVPGLSLRYAHEMPPYFFRVMLSSDVGVLKTAKASRPSGRSEI